MEENNLPIKAKKFICLTLCVMILCLSAFLTVGKVQASYRGGIYVIDDEQNISDHIWSSNGSQIAYLKFPDGKPYWDGELWVANRSEYSAKLRDKRQIVLDPTYLPIGNNVSSIEDWYGEWILFHVRNEQGTPSEYYGASDLWKIKADGTELTQITFTGAYANGIRTTWSNTAYRNRGTVGWARFIPGTDGELVYMSAHNGNGWWNPYTCTTDGSFQWQELGNQNDGADNSFTIGMSPTGNKLVWGDANYWNYRTTLRSSNIDGSGLVTIKAFTYRVPPLVLSDGNTITFRYVYAGDIGAVPDTLEGNIYSIEMDGSNEKTILDDEYLNYPENYHPLDGQAMLMSSNRAPDGNWHIFSLNVSDPNADTGIVQLTDGTYNDVAAMYSPDARYIMYRRLPEDFDTVTNPVPYPYELVVKRIFVFPTPGFSFFTLLLAVPVIILMKRRRK